jgi:hypothetical protein
MRRLFPFSKVTLWSLYRSISGQALMSTYGHFSLVETELNRDAKTKEEKSYNERKALILQWKKIENMISDNGFFHLEHNSFPYEVLSPVQIAGFFIDRWWDEATSRIRYDIINQKDFKPQTREYWEAVNFLVSSAIKGINICKRCRLKMEKNHFSNVCEKCTEFEMNYVRKGDLGKVLELKDKEKEIYTHVPQKRQYINNDIDDNDLPF